MTRTRVVFPSFREQGYSAYDMRQLVSALEIRFQSLESETDSIFGYSSGDLSDTYALAGHTHVANDIVDLPDIPNSIYDLDDVTGPATTGQALIWNGAVFEASDLTIDASTIRLNDLFNVSVPAPTNGQVLEYQSSSGTWIAADNAQGTLSLGDLTDVDVNAAKYDMLWYDGLEWTDTDSLKWNPGAGYLQLDNGFSINWLESDGATTVELLDFTGGGGTDPLFSDVADVTNFEGADGQQSLTTFSGAWSFTSGCKISTDQFFSSPSSLYVDGTDNEYIQAPSNTPYLPGTSDFTIEMHLRPSNVSHVAYIASIVEVGTNNQSWMFAQNVSARFYAYLYFDGASGTVQLGGGTNLMTLNTWRHYVVMRQGTNLYLFVDGVLIDSGTCLANEKLQGQASITAPMRLGLNNGNFSSYHGYIDNFRFTNAARYNPAGFTPPSVGESYPEGVAAFTVGDPLRTTTIEGLTTTITSALTDVDGALNVDGTSTHNGGVFAYSPVADTTTPILTLQTDLQNVDRRLINFHEDTFSGFYLWGDWSPNTPSNRLVFGSDKPSGEDRIFDIGERGEFAFDNNRITYDAAGLNAGSLIMDGVGIMEVGDGNTTNSVRLDILPGTGLDATLGLFEDAANFTKAYGASLTYDGGDNTFYLRTHDNSVPGVPVISIPRAGTSISYMDGKATFDTSSNPTFTLFDTSKTDSAAFAHNGTDFTTVFTTTGDWDITGLAGGEVNLDGSLTVQENLTVSGTLTSLNTSDVNIADNIIVLNSDVTGTPTEDAGIEIERGTESNRAVRWNETLDRWEFTNDGSTYYAIVTAHTGEVTGETALTVDVTAITNRTDVVAEAADDVAIHDDTDGTLKKTNLSSITDGGYF